MEKVTVSPKFQVVIPRTVRERLRIVAGQKLQVIAIGDRNGRQPYLRNCQAGASLGVDTGRSLPRAARDAV